MGGEPVLGAAAERTIICAGKGTAREGLAGPEVTARVGRGAGNHRRLAVFRRGGLGLLARGRGSERERKQQAEHRGARGAALSSARQRRFCLFGMFLFLATRAGAGVLSHNLEGSEQPDEHIGCRVKTKLKINHSGDCQ